MGVGVVNEDIGVSFVFVEVKLFFCLCWRLILCVNNEVMIGNVCWDVNGVCEEYWVLV